MVRHLAGDVWLASRRLWGMYVASDGELDPAPLAAALRSRGAVVALPIMSGPRLQFATGDRLRRGRWGITEPDPRYARRMPVWCLQVVVTPVVAFDDRGVRLGRGGGFYDRTFGATHLHRRPFLLGLAHDCQRVDWLPQADHDVPLDAVLTPGGLFRFR